MFMGLGRVGQEMFLQAFRTQTLERTTVTLPDGTIGYYERGMRSDDCFAACLATCLQVPIEDVPDPRIDERLQAGESPEDVDRSACEELGRWLTARGLCMVTHRPPVASPRWIGVIEFVGAFNDHTVVMAGDTILFDPVDRSRYSRPVRTYTVEDVSGGFTFEQLDSTSRPRRNDG